MFNGGGLRFILALRIVLPVIAETLLNGTIKYSGTCLLIALYTMPTFLAVSYLEYQIISNASVDD